MWNKYKSLSQKLLSAIIKWWKHKNDQCCTKEQHTVLELIPYLANTPVWNLISLPVSHSLCVPDAWPMLIYRDADESVSHRPVKTNNLHTVIQYITSESETHSSSMTAAFVTVIDKKLSYRRVTARCVLSVVILPITTQQCRNYLYDKSWRNRWYEVVGLVGGNVS